MNYRQIGQGQPVVLIHGYPLNSRLWQPQLDSLADVAHLIAPDLRGHGDSEAIPGPYSMDLLADDCAALLDALDIREPVVVNGLSMGGYIAMAFARRYPERLAGLVLTATRSGADSEASKAGRDQAANQAREQGVNAIVEAMLPKLLAPDNFQFRPDLVDEARAIMSNTSLEGVLGDLEGMKTRPDSTPSLPQISVPTRILHGAEDQIISKAEARAMVAALPDAGLVIIPGAGHLPNLEQPETYNQLLGDFILSLS
jgi:pimeloyl-ACP methyl ester carboxylesterase